MNRVYITLLGLALVLGGCVTKGQAQAQARAAFLAGQRQALMSVAQKPSQTLSISIRGEVQNPMVPWTPELTLAKAIVAAGYKGQHDPTNIIIIRNGHAIQVDPRKLLNGQDMPLEPMDIVALAEGPGPISSGNTAAYTPSPSAQ